MPILSVQAVYHPASAASTPRLRREGGVIQMPTHQDTVFVNRIGMRTLKIPPCTISYLHVVLSNDTIQ
jgi:hypothetical protein